MNLVIDTGSLLVNLALIQVFSIAGHTALPADKAPLGFSPDILLLGNNFDSALSLVIFPRACAVVFDIGLTFDRLEQAARSDNIRGILPRFVSLEDFDEAFRFLANKRKPLRGGSAHRSSAKSGPSFN